MKYLLIPLTLMLVSCSTSSTRERLLAIDSFPSISLLKSDSTMYNLRQLPQAKGYLLFYFSPTCPHSRYQLKYMISKKDSLEGILVLMISLTDLTTLRDFEKNFELNKYPNILTTLDIDTSALHFYHIQRVPTIAIYGSDKKIRKINSGKITVSKIDSIISSKNNRLL